MTDQIFDDRAAAYVGAREHLDAATQLKAEHHRAVLEDRAVPDELPAEYWALIAEAAVLSNLARADAAVGYLAGHYRVDQGERIDRAKRRQLKEGIRSKLAEVRERGEGVTKHDQPAGRPPFAGGHTVRLLEGDWKGRTGQILETHLSENSPTMLTVQLFPPGYPHDPSTPIQLDVREDQAELVIL